MYNTQTNIISSIPDFNIILRVLSDYSRGTTLDKIMDNMIVGNLYGIRTKSSRKRYYFGINSTFLQFNNRDHRNFITTVFSNDFPNITQRFIAYIQMAVNNELFYLLTKDVLAELLFNGRLTVDKQIFVAYINDLKRINIDKIEWTDETVITVASKYLTLMKKLGFLKGTQKKEFCSFTPTDEMIILAVYLITSLNPEKASFLKNPYSSLLLMTSEGIMERLRRVSLQKYISISTTGNDMKVELKYDYKDIAGEIRKNN